MLGRFTRDQRGSVLFMFSIAFPMILVVIGMAIDYSRGLAARQTIASAIDAAALAAGTAVNMSELEIEAQAQAYFDANKAPGQSATISVATTNDKVTISATGTVDTTFLRLISITKLDVAASTEVSKRNRKIELVMVLDNTGSMSWSGKLDALKSAANTLLDILMPQAEHSANGDVKIGLVPFAAAVNIGPDKLNSGWLDTNALSTIAWEDFAAGTNALTLYDDILNRSWNGCVRARNEPYDTTDTPPAVAASDTLWAPYFAPDEPDNGWYANRYAPDDGYTGGEFDYDARQRYTGKYVNYALLGWVGSDGPSFNCWTPQVTPLTATHGDVQAGIELMTASGSTVIPAGLAWGWRLISPDEPFIEGAAYDDDDYIKAIVLLTDGQNSVGGGLGNHNNSYYNAFGYAQSGHLGATNGSQAEATLNAKTTTLCDNIKAEGVILYTITFQLSDGPIKDLMRDCATSTNMYYDSPDNSQLQTIFEEIAIGLSELRISK